MNAQIIAVIVQEGGRFISEILRTRSPKRKAQVEYPPIAVESIEPQEAPEQTTAKTDKASSIEAGCVPCSLGHLSVCAGNINEAMRFARSKGIDSNEVIDRVSHCLQELNALEREDLTPEMIINLPKWEKDLAVEALETSRATRHLLEGMTTVDELEKVAAKTQTANTHISRKWFKQRLAKMPKEEKAKLAEKAIEQLEGE